MQIQISMNELTGWLVFGMLIAFACGYWCGKAEQLSKQVKNQGEGQDGWEDEALWWRQYVWPIVMEHARKTKEPSIEES